MLGILDESHIVRTIEYWDIERRLNPAREHRAVIIAEEITNRFFNVIGLFNKSIPVIAIQLNAFRVDETFVLNFVKVLDIAETFDAEDQGDQEQVDRKYWESRSNPESIDLMDRIIAMINEISVNMRITYNRSHIAIGTVKNNFCWCQPRKKSHLHFVLDVGEDIRDQSITKLEENGIECKIGNHPATIKANLTRDELDKNIDTIKQMVVAAEKYSKE